MTEPIFDWEANLERMTADRLAQEVTEREQQKRQREIDAERRRQERAVDPNAPVGGPNASGRYRPLANDATDSEKALSCLERMSVHCFSDYDDWVHVGMALHHVDDGLLQEWDSWSAGDAEKYPGFRELETKWKSFGNKDGFSIGSLIEWARQADPDFLRPGFNGGGGGFTAPLPEWLHGEEAPDYLNVMARLHEQLEENDLLDLIEALHLEWDMPIGEGTERWLEKRKAERDQLDAQIEEGNVDCLPPNAAKWLPKLIPGFQFDNRVMLMMYLTALGGAMPLHSKVEAWAGFDQPLSLYTMLMMPSGSNKSTLLNAMVTKPWAASVNDRLKDAYELELNRWKQERLEYDRWRNAGMVGDPPTDEPIKPQLPHCLFSGTDITVQGIGRHAMNMEQYSWARRSILWILDEGIRGLDMLVDKRDTALKSTLLSMYDGRGSTSMKADSENERNYSQCRMSMMMLVQDLVFEEKMQGQDETGLVARFTLIKQKEGMTYTKLTREEMMIAQMEQASASAYLEYRYRFASEFEAGPADPYVLHLSNGAFGLMQDTVARNTAYAIKYGNDPIRQSLSGKNSGQVLRIAGLLEVAWALDEENGRMPQEISAETLKRAIKLADSNTATMAKVRLESVCSNPISRHACAYQKALTASDEPGGMTYTDIRKSSGNSECRLSKELVMGALDLLAAKGKLRRVKGKNGKGWRYLKGT